MNTFAGTVHKALVDAGIPIVGISIGKIDDKGTWRVDYEGEPTSEQLASAKGAIDAFDIAAAKIAVEAGSDPAITAAGLYEALKAKGILAAEDFEAKA